MNWACTSFYKGITSNYIEYPFQVKEYSPQGTSVDTDAHVFIQVSIKLKYNFIFTVVFKTEI